MLTLCFAALHAAPQEPNRPMPRYAGQNLIRPENYREWIFLSSGLGMSYNPSPEGHEMFTNVFVPQWSYGQFLASGKWPDKTIFVVEERGSQSKGSINKTGHCQTDLMGMGVEVKDESRFPEKWAYFNFGADTKPAGANPKAACRQCHDDHAAVEHTFVQFYPTLKQVAKKFGTYRDAAENVSLAASDHGPGTHRLRSTDMYGMIVKLTAASGQRESLISILLTGTGEMSGCLSYIVAKDFSDENTIWITEIWDSKASHDASLSLPSVQSAIAKAKPMIAVFGTPVVTTPVGGHGLQSTQNH
jgi:quinol monooxygenase YgiN